MSAHLYILQSLRTGAFYIGSTSDLHRRLAEHERQHTPSTRRRGPWKLVYQQEFADLLQARRRERQIKSWKSHRTVQELIEGRNFG